MSREQALQFVRPLAVGPETIREIEKRYSKSFFLVDGYESVPEMADPSVYDRQELAPEEYEAFQEVFWRSVFREQAMSLAEFTPFRVKVVWRITRALAQMRRLITADEFLYDMREPWDSTKCLRLGRDKRNMDEFLILDTLKDHCLLPPPVPEGWIMPDGTISSEYNPASRFCDPLLHDFIDGISRVVDYLGVRKGSREDPHQGRYGLLGLLDPSLTRLAWPTKEAIMGYEMVFVDEALSHLVEHAQLDTQKWLLAQHGLRLPEIQSAMTLVKATVRNKYMSTDVEEDRVLMVLRLEDFILRARQSLDLKAELGALKNLALIQGLGKADPRDEVAEFVDVVKRVASQAEAKQQEILLIESEGPE